MKKKTKKNKHNLRFHRFAVHAEEGDRQSVGEEFLFDFHCVSDDGEDALLARLVLQMLEHEAGEVAVEPFVAGDQFVAERQT